MNSVDKSGCLLFSKSWRVASIWLVLKLKSILMAAIDDDKRKWRQMLVHRREMSYIYCVFFFKWRERIKLAYRTCPLSSLQVLQHFHNKMPMNIWFVAKSVISIMMFMRWCAAHQAPHGHDIRRIIKQIVCIILCFVLLCYSNEVWIDEWWQVWCMLFMWCYWYYYLFQIWRQYASKRRWNHANYSDIG